MSKGKIAVLIVALLLCGGFVWWYHERHQNRLTVENRSGQPIAVLRVAITGETATFRDVAADSQVTGTFRIASDDHFTVEGRLADGKRITGQFGYVTGGMSGQRARFVVQPEGKIEFHQSGEIVPY
jgi:hypothetical protein